MRIKAGLFEKLLFLKHNSKLINGAVGHPALPGLENSFVSNTMGPISVQRFKEAVR
jgi:hypothetical protein